MSKSSSDAVHELREAAGGQRKANMNREDLQPGKRYWFPTGNDKIPVLSGLFTGKFENNSRLAVLMTRKGDRWLIKPDRICKTEDEVMTLF